jgi:hypothetical protein
MTTEQFTYWLQGFMEVANPTTLDEKQTQIIKDHLALVFDKQTPDRTFIPPLTPIPTMPYPNQIEPDWWGGKNRVICGTDSYIDDGENPMEKKYCSHMVPQHMFGSKEENTVGTDSMKVTKLAMHTVSKDVRLPKVVREGKVGKVSVKC